MRVSIFPKKRKKPDEEFIEAYDAYAHNILRHIYIRVSSHSSAEDILSETFLKTWQFIAGGGEIKNIKSFLYKIANNLIIDFYRGKHKTPVSLEKFSEDIVSKEVSIEEKIDKKTRDTFLKNHLNTLPHPYREIIIYTYIDELNVKEIRQITGKTAANIYVILHRGIAMLKHRIKKEFDEKKR